MGRGEKNHRPGEAVDGTTAGAKVGGAEVGPAGEDFGQLGDGRLIVGRDGESVRAEGEGAVGLELGQADGEELHDFAGVVLVGRGAGDGVGFGVTQGAEVAAHRRVEGDVFEEGAEVAEGAVAEEIVVVGDGFSLVVAAEAHVGDDEDLAEGEGDALAKLVGSGEGVFEPRGLAVVRVDGVPIAETLGAAIGVAVGDRGRAVRGKRQGHLRGDPGVDTAAGEGVDFGLSGSEGGLGEQARGIGYRDTRERDGGRRVGRDEGARTRTLDEGALHLAGGIFGGVDADRDLTALQRLEQLGPAIKSRGGETPLRTVDLSVGAEAEDKVFVGAEDKIGVGDRRTKMGEGDVDRGERAAGAKENRSGAGSRRATDGAAGRSNPCNVKGGGAISDADRGGVGEAHRVACATRERDHDGIGALDLHIGIGRERDFDRAGAGRDLDGAREERIVIAVNSGTTDDVVHRLRQDETTIPREREFAGVRAGLIADRLRSGNGDVAMGCWRSCIFVVHHAPKRSWCWLWHVAAHDLWRIRGYCSGVG